MVFFWAVIQQLTLQSIDTFPKYTQQQIKDLNCLARNIYYEAGNEPFSGKVAVAQVTLNRVEHDDFPSSICSVVYEKTSTPMKTICQFSWYCDKKVQSKPVDKKTFDESMAAAREVLIKGLRIPNLKDAIYYHADYVRPGWKKSRIVKIGRHIFYADNRK